VRSCPGGPAHDPEDDLPQRQHGENQKRQTGDRGQCLLHLERPEHGRQLFCVGHHAADVQRPELHRREDAVLGQHAERHVASEAQRTKEVDHEVDRREDREGQRHAGEEPGQRDGGEGVVQGGVAQRRDLGHRVQPSGIERP